MVAAERQLGNARIDSPVWNTWSSVDGTVLTGHGAFKTKNLTGARGPLGMGFQV